MDWCAEFMVMYNEVESLTLAADQIISIFWLVEKYINKWTLHLLEIVIIRASSSSLDILFQYDVLKLLHTVIVYEDFKTNETNLNRSCSS